MLAKRLTLALVLTAVALWSVGCPIKACDEDKTTNATYGFSMPFYTTIAGNSSQIQVVELNTVKSANDKVTAWSVQPTTGAEVSSSGVFTATIPGDYRVTAKVLGVEQPIGVGVNVQENPESAGTTEPPAFSVDETSTTEYVPGSGPILISMNGNADGVFPGGTAPTFELTTAVLVTKLEDYHYMIGGLSRVGTITIRAEDGTTYGPFQTVGSPGQGGVANAYWTAYPDNLVLPAGRYTIIDSDPSTFSQNEGSAGVGMYGLWGIPQQ
jgi:hypothetical protein